jgi:hypothetical protein
MALEFRTIVDSVERMRVRSCGLSARPQNGIRDCILSASALGKSMTSIADTSENYAKTK